MPAPAVLIPEARRLGRHPAPEQVRFVGVAACPDIITTPPEKPTSETLRDALASAPDWIQAKFDPYLDYTARALFGDQSALVRHKPHGQSWAAWLSSRGTPSELRALYDMHTANVMAVNNDPEIRGILESRRAWFMRNLYDGMRAKYFSSNTLIAISRMRHTRFVFGDPLVDEELHIARGYWRDGAKEVVLNQKLEVPLRQQRQELLDFARGLTPAHELAHAGFGLRFPAWFEESGTEDCVQLVNLLAKGEDPGDLYPSRHSDEDLRRSYAWGRLLRYAMLNYGKYQVGIKEYMRAWSSEGPDSPEMARFERAMDRAWGIRHSFRRISARVRKIEEALLANSDGQSRIYLMNRAALQVAEELRTDPSKVFGRGYKQQAQQRHMGSVALGNFRIQRTVRAIF
ncbi:hypothetical protein IRY61_05915 [Candidatus Saccharibacteria bacterium]|nr:hypothetical protein [Candidatus Saccharibacteria bacterium]